MGIIKAVKDTVGGALDDQFIEAVEPGEMNEGTVFAKGVLVRRDGKRNNNRPTEDYISDGSIVHVYEKQFMFIVDGGKIVDYSAEPGYFRVKNDAAPSLFNGNLQETAKKVLLETFERFKFGGQPSGRQQVFYINMQEIKGLKFGTRSPINYFDSFYNAELFLRAHGTYSIRVTDPLKFYQEVISKTADHVEMAEINEQYLNEFLEALQSAINQMSADGQRISFVTSKSRELGQYMSATLDDAWKQARGMEIQAVGIASLSYDDESQKLINMRNQGAMLADASVREGYVQGAMARGVEAAGGNAAGAGQAFMGVGLGMQAGGNMAAAFSQSNQAQMAAPKAAPSPAPAAANGAYWVCACGGRNDEAAKFCGQCGQSRPKDEAGWLCACGADNPASSKFCGQCGKSKPKANVCVKCQKPLPEAVKFCPECGAPSDGA